MDRIELHEKRALKPNGTQNEKKTGMGFAQYKLTFTFLLLYDLYVLDYRYDFNYSEVQNRCCTLFIVIVWTIFFARAYSF